MRFGRRRFSTRQIALAAGAFGLSVALLILWLGHRYDQETDLLAAQGQLAQGVYINTTYNSSSNSRDSSSTIEVGYRVDGVEYRTSMSGGSSRGTKPIFEPERVRVPRLGPEKPFQVVYLPSDPTVARVREDMSKSDVAVYGTAGMFGFIGLVFGSMGFFVFPSRRPMSVSRPMSGTGNGLGAKTKTYPCRKCNAPLDRSKHIVFSHHEAREEIVSGSDPSRTRTVHDAVFKHIACTNCGEPKPLATIRANLATFLTLSVIISLMVAGFVVVFFL